MHSREKISVFWFRRDLRLEDNTALHQALSGGSPVLPLFIFDPQIIDELPEDDARVTFIYRQLHKIHTQLQALNSSLHIYKGEVLEVWKILCNRYEIEAVFANKDYEPYAIERDGEVVKFLAGRGIGFHSFKDQVMFEEHEILKKDGKPYTVFTPYKRAWLERFQGSRSLSLSGMPEQGFCRELRTFPGMNSLGFKSSSVEVRPYDLSCIDDYARLRDFPGPDATSHLSPHLRFGTVSIRQVISRLGPAHEVFLSELIWREFFMQILFHFPRVVDQNFHPKYNGVAWLNRAEDLERWSRGLTGYPLVDAGMRELNARGTMHNRVRMVTASFLCKHLLVDWRMGEAYFARKLLDYELSSNNGNWQWAAGTGCDAAPYFRVFNPTAQLKKFDADLEYVKRWIPEFGTPEYPAPMVEHPEARQRALDTFREGIRNYLPEG